MGNSLNFILKNKRNSALWWDPVCQPCGGDPLLSDWDLLAGSLHLQPLCGVGAPAGTKLRPLKDLHPSGWDSGYHSCHCICSLLCPSASLRSFGRPQNLKYVEGKKEEEERRKKKKEVATTSALARTMCVGTHSIRTNSRRTIEATNPCLPRWSTSWA